MVVTWAVLFFIALFFAGFSSSISHLETPVTSFINKYNWSRKKAVTVYKFLIDCE
jgi:SNF family Na+-dependent transporter